MSHTQTTKKSLQPLTEDIERYTASAEDLATVCCFLVFQEIGEPPRKTNQPVINLFVRGQLTQSELHQPDKCKSQFEPKRIP